MVTGRSSAGDRGQGTKGTNMVQDGAGDMLPSLQRAQCGKVGRPHWASESWQPWDAEASMNSCRGGAGEQRRILGHRQVQRDQTCEDTGREGHLQVWEKGCRRNQPRSSLVAQGIKTLVLSWLLLQFDLWPWKFHMPYVWPKKRRRSQSY